ncbi:MAG: hypothetical protein GXO21_04815, partial [Aquificae bacterium]|nr:hypothetical protein [Aquificota bacterium]
VQHTAVKIILQHCEDKEDGRKLVYKFAEETQKLLGDKGSFAVMRQLGKELAKKLMKEYPKEEWEKVLSTALNNLGFAKEIIKEKDKAFICDCVFFEILEENNIKPVSHAVCWTGWGFIEGFVKEIDGVNSIKWSSRDYNLNRCQFDFIKE